MDQASSNQSVRSLKPDDDATVAHEMGRLDTDVLTEEVRQLREQVEVALREKLLAERKHTGGAKDARRDFDAARASYLAKALELRAAQRRLSNAAEPNEPSSALSVERSPQDNDRVVHGPPAKNLDAHPSPAAIGSIDMDAVFKRYERAKVSNQKYNILTTKASGAERTTLISSKGRTPRDVAAPTESKPQS